MGPFRHTNSLIHLIPLTHYTISLTLTRPRPHFVPSTQSGFPSFTCCLHYSASSSSDTCLSTSRYFFSALTPYSLTHYLSITPFLLPRSVPFLLIHLPSRSHSTPHALTYVFFLCLACSWYGISRVLPSFPTLYPSPFPLTPPPSVPTISPHPFHPCQPPPPPPPPPAAVSEGVGLYVPPDPTTITTRGASPNPFPPSYTQWLPSPSWGGVKLA